MRNSTINGALIDAARVRPNAVYGERGRLRGPATVTRLTRTA